MVINMGKDFSSVLEGRKIAPLTLDQNWHKLFAVIKPSKQLKSLEKQLDTLIKKQGRATTQSKEIRKLKSKLMKEILQLQSTLQDGERDAKTQKKLDEHSRLIGECNDKLTDYEDDLLELPAQIERVNKALLLETMELCYFELNENERVIDKITAWITNVRVELKKQILRKQDREIRNQEVYHYLHGIFGPEVLDLFDVKYDWEQKRTERIEMKREQKQRGAKKQEAGTQEQKARTDGNKEK